MLHGSNKLAFGTCLCSLNLLQLKVLFSVMTSRSHILNVGNKLEDLRIGNF
jgi:hypothetical protein